RAERQAAYSTTRSDMGKYVAPVQACRKAETLDFSKKERMNVTLSSMVSSASAATDLEKRVSLLLKAGGMTETEVAEKELEELKAKAFTSEEVQDRQQELARMRALMFYQERKQHHMNKIKSKVYRKIRKRQRDRQGPLDASDLQTLREADLEETQRLEEEQARKRVEERMTLRHKNTSKWVKKTLRARGGASANDRRAITEQLQLGQELREKVWRVKG
ncbi:unnamed protein product, partial [Discosporangium mesarthrocarpum]